jgi:hypothetical protein
MVGCGVDLTEIMKALVKLEVSLVKNRPGGRGNHYPMIRVWPDGP